MKIDALITKYSKKVETLKKQLKESEDKLSLLREIQLESIFDTFSELTTTNTLTKTASTSCFNANKPLYPPCESWDYLNTQFNNIPLASDAIKPLTPLDLTDLQIKPLNLDALRKF